MRLRTAAAALMLGIALAPISTNDVGATPEQTTGPGLSGYDLRGRGSGVLTSYDIPGRLPISPIVDIASPDVESSVAVGPTAAASASLAYPGSLVLSLDTIFAQFGGYDNPLPAYPAIVRAPTTSGSSAEDTTTVPGGSMAANAEGATSSAEAIMPGRATPAVAESGTVEATSTTTVDGGLATTHVRVEIDGIDLLGGIVHIDGLITDLTVTSDGVTATTSGGTTVAGASALGLPAVIDADGIRFVDEGATPPTSADPTDGPLGPLGQGLAPVADLTAGVTSLLGGDPSGLEELLQEVGISMRLAEPVSEVQGPAGSLRSAGLAIDFSTELDATPLGELLDAIPPLPDLAGSPFQPADFVAIIGANHVTGMAFGAATATASGRPVPVRVRPDRPDGTATAASPSGGGSSSPASATSGSSNPATASTPASGNGNPVASQPAGLQLPFADLVGWRVVFLAVAAALVGSFGTRKLPDLALAPSAARRCALGNAPDRSSP